MKDEATNEFDPLKFDAEFARVFDERIAAQVPSRMSETPPWRERPAMTDKTLSEIARLTGQLHIRAEENSKLSSQKAMLVSDLADANLKIGVLVITNVLALIVGVVMTALLIWN
jgi:hypothetical protein